MSCTFDTNILVYTLGQPADVKRQRAQSLIIRGARCQTAVLLLQSLAEFSHVATRKFGVSVASVRRRVDGWCGGFPVQPAAEPDLAAALDLVSAHNISCIISVSMWLTVGRSARITESARGRRRRAISVSTDSCCAVRRRRRN